MNNAQNLADRIAAGDIAATACVRGIVKLRSNNLIERPWGGLRMLEYKGCAPLPDQKKITGMGLGEAFEIAACPSDPESEAHPSIACLSDGSEIALPQLLHHAGRNILGKPLFERFHGEIPLLPKTLDIEELLSVQAHPPGNTELYVIIDAQPGASIRLGFRHNVDPDSLRRELIEGRKKQNDLLQLLRADVDHNQLHNTLAPALASRDDDLQDLIETLKPLLADDADVAAVHQCLLTLRAVYWHVLDLMNEVAVRPGQIIHNATPARVCRVAGIAPSAEVHALGNPDRREILMLEIRRPGKTFRAWDHVRFPIRDIEIDQALSALHCGATSPEEFEVTPKPLSGAPGVFRSVKSDSFIVDHIRPEKDRIMSIAGKHFHTLHLIHGSVVLIENTGNTTKLTTGESAIVPATVDAYQVAADASAELIRVNLPSR
ncbi:MAG: hypothetical protein OER80_02010 [Gammaproteobacteria bacterium]|nr:hypothetical protein [Gammaproteobacteria bacterium]